MTAVIHMNATEARKNLYKLIDKVSRGELKVVIQNKNNNKTVLLKAEAGAEDLSVQEGLKIVEETFGAIKTGGYKENEFEIAQKEFVKEYKKKYDLT